MATIAAQLIIRIMLVLAQGIIENMRPNMHRTRKNGNLVD